MLLFFSIFVVSYSMLCTLKYFSYKLILIKIHLKLPIPKLCSK